MDAKRGLCSTAGHMGSLGGAEDVTRVAAPVGDPGWERYRGEMLAIAPWLCYIGVVVCCRQ